MAGVGTAGSNFSFVNGEVAKFLLRYSTLHASRGVSAGLLGDSDWQLDIRWWKIWFLNFSSGENHAGILKLLGKQNPLRAKINRKERSILPSHTSSVQKMFILALGFPISQRWRTLGFLFYKRYGYFQRPVIQQNYPEILFLWIFKEAVPCK